MNAPLLSDLREPPVVGRFYMVPVVRDYPWHGKCDTWPVLGPLHSDEEHFNFPWPHYHLDVRFLSARLTAFVACRAYGSPPNIFSAAQSAPLHHRDITLPKGRPALARLKCMRTEVPYVHGFRPQVRALRADYPDPAPAIARKDGRLLCPHRKVDLSSFAPDADGVVTCPLHGLRVQCAKVAA